MTKPLKRMRPLLGTYVEVGLLSANTALAQEAFAEAFARIEKIQQLLSAHDPESELSRLNAHPGEEMELHPWSVAALRLARGITLASQHLFNCTVGGRMAREGVLPRFSPAGTLDSGGAHDIQIRGLKVRLCRPIQITLDGIAKGYAVDLAVHALKDLGATAGWVNAGGDMRAFGTQSLTVHRREASGQIRAWGELKNGAIATSVVRRNQSASFPGWIVGGKTKPHLGTWTVAAPTAWRADALTKVASLAPPSRRRTWVEELGGQWLDAPGVA